MNTASVINFLKRVKRKGADVAHAVDLKLAPMFALNGFLASVYFTFINRSFYREHVSVLKGRLSYAKSLIEIKQSSALLRRNTHRLEKGLIMQPRRAIFAKAYIGETVECYQRCLVQGTVDPEEMHWASDVLCEYFSVVSNEDRIINKSREKYLALKKQFASNDIKVNSASKPYQYRELPSIPVQYEALRTLFRRRRSVRWYQAKPVPRSLIEQAVCAASLAPSACNRQPYRFVYFDTPEEVAEVAALAMGTSGFNHQLPCLFVVVGDLSCYPKGRDRHVIYIDGSLAAMQLMLALETLGLSSCPINWPDIEARERKMAKRLKLGLHERVVMLIATGYAAIDGGVPFSQKKSAATLLEAH